MAPGRTEITTEDLEHVGSVEGALAEYYAEQVWLAATVSGVAEREIRIWFERKLITERHQRGQVAKHVNEAGGLDISAVRQLAQVHIVREGGPFDATWVELAHDRLIEPVLADNERWREAKLQKFQIIAEHWEMAG